MRKRGGRTRSTAPSPGHRARVTKQPRERLGWAYTEKDYFRDRNLMPDLVALQRNVDLTRDLGFIKASFDVAKQSDLSLVQEAAKRLK